MLINYQTISVEMRYLGISKAALAAKLSLSSRAVYAWNKRRIPSFRKVEVSRILERATTDTLPPFDFALECQKHEVTPVAVMRAMGFEETQRPHVRWKTHGVPPCLRERVLMTIHLLGELYRCQAEMRDQGYDVFTAE